MLVNKPLGFPDTVKVGAFDISILPYDNNIARVEGRFGDFSSTLMQIRVDTSIDKYLILSTLLHEIMHAMWYVASLHNSESIVEEQVVDVMANSLTQVLRDNPQLLKFINLTSTEA